MLGGRLITRFHQRHRAQVITAVELPLLSFFERAEQIRHRADERVGKPNLAPPRADPLWAAGDRREIERAGRALGILRPADRPSGHPCGPFYTPMDPNVGRRAFPRGTR